MGLGDDTCPVLNLGQLDGEVLRRSERWTRGGFSWRRIDWTAGDKPAAQLVLTSAGLEGELLVWASGEAEIGWCNLPAGSGPHQRHYDLADEGALAACLDDLEAHLELES